MMTETSRITLRQRWLAELAVKCPKSLGRHRKSSTDIIRYLQISSVYIIDVPLPWLLKRTGMFHSIVSVADVHARLCTYFHNVDYFTVKRAKIQFHAIFQEFYAPWLVLSYGSYTMSKNKEQLPCGNQTWQLKSPHS
jgi:hypothetical protein